MRTFERFVLHKYMYCKTIDVLRPGQESEDTAMVVARQYAKRRPPFRRVILVVTPHRLLLFDALDLQQVVARIAISKLLQVESRQRTVVLVETSATPASGKGANTQPSGARDQSPNGACAEGEGERRTCHVLRCDSSRKAEAVVRVTAKAFNRAFYQWQQSQLRQPKAVSLLPFYEPPPLGQTVDKKLSPLISPVVAVPRPLTSNEKPTQAPARNERETPSSEKFDDLDNDALLELHRDFTRRSLRLKTPERLDTCSVSVKDPSVFDWDDAGDYVMGTPIDLLKF